mmetsp:Transcript_50006/g.143968  ORF Transcript_50006/g.143968 Transcript_50006/m.143968 type:complete len:460 (+) Transcript_50006:1395-2774(+)
MRSIYVPLVVASDRLAQELGVWAMLPRRLANLLHAYPHPARHVVRGAEVRVVDEELPGHDGRQPRPRLMRRPDLVEGLLGVRVQSLLHPESASVPLDRRLEKAHGDGSKDEYEGVDTNAQWPDHLYMLHGFQVPLRHELPDARNLGHVLKDALRLLHLRNLGLRLLLATLVPPLLLPDLHEDLLRGDRLLRDLGLQDEVRRLGVQEAVLNPHVVGDLGAGHCPENVLDLGDAPVAARVFSQHLRGGVPADPIAQVELVVRPLATKVGDEHSVHRLALPIGAIDPLDHQLPLCELADAELVVSLPLGHPHGKLLLDRSASDLLLIAVSSRIRRTCRLYGAAGRPAEERGQDAAASALLGIGLLDRCGPLLQPLLAFGLFLAGRELVVERLEFLLQTLDVLGLPLLVRLHSVDLIPDLRDVEPFQLFIDLVVVAAIHRARLCVDARMAIRPMGHGGATKTA